MLGALLLGAGLSLAKDELIDRPKEMQQAQMKALEMKAAPDMGQSVQGMSGMKRSDSMQKAIDAGLTAAMFSKSMSKDSVGKDAVKSPILKSVASNSTAGAKPGLNAAMFSGRAPIDSGSAFIPKPASFKKPAWDDGSGALFSNGLTEIE